MSGKPGASPWDEDFAALDRLFALVDATPDAGLASLFGAIAAELAARFARQEKAMTEARAPFLLAHIELQQHLMNEIDRMRTEIAGAEPQAVRQLVGTLSPLLVRQYAATAQALRRRNE